MAKERNISTGRNAVLNGFRTALNMLLPLITIPYVTRVLQPENLGKYNFGNSVISYFQMIAALGITSYTVRESAKFRDDKVRFKKFCSEVFTINMISTLVSYLLLFGCVILHIFSGYENLLLIFSIEIVFITIGTEWLYTIYEDFTYITVRSITFKVVSVILIFLLVRKPEDYLVYAGITVFSIVGPNIINIWYVQKHYCQIRLVRKCNCREHLKPILILFVSTIATTVYVNSDITMLGIFESDYLVGIYSVSARIYAAVKEFLTSLMLVSVPRMSLLIGQNKQREFTHTLTRIVNYLALLVFPAVTGLFVLSREIILLIAGEAYIEAVSSLRLLCIALMICVFGLVYNDCVLLPAKKEKIVLAATVMTAVVNVSVNYFLIPFWHENAVAFSTILAEAMLMVIRVYFGRKIAKLEKGVLQNLLSAVSGCVVIVFVCLLIQSLHVSTLVTVLLSVLFSVIFYGLTLLLFRNRILWDALHKVRDRWLT
ncbi:MAG: flippase [Lachnospiraceae bacterium]|nr:flippase [Lachnospiraceae bacterium]